MFEKVREIIVSNLSCDLEAVTMEASLTEDLELDSLDAVDLNAALEEELGFAMPDEVLKDIQTVGDIVRYLEAHDGGAE
ncbi:acyl carrier protein [Pseudoflavonifractor sp. 524-17]|uniref:acyl carrier protein n=1 Tax=Pseudoflavonifractor sp. 524-17 TaxID=2304577 RepID=UPI00137A24C5|nr:acyl carrier protein [Pseudoflavonifractor sp. 524-17]NCE63552.1 acyl carrier protein [Pseudoflavonifractor sp. 524-17]